MGLASDGLSLVIFRQPIKSKRENHEEGERSFTILMAITIGFSGFRWMWSSGFRWTWSSFTLKGISYLCKSCQINKAWKSCLVWTLKFLILTVIELNTQAWINTGERVHLYLVVSAWLQKGRTASEGNCLVSMRIGLRDRDLRNQIRVFYLPNQF